MKATILSYVGYVGRTARAPGTAAVHRSAADRRLALRAVIPPSASARVPLRARWQRSSATGRLEMRWEQAPAVATEPLGGHSEAA